MAVYDVPDWVIRKYMERGQRNDDLLLYCASRALRFVDIALDNLAALDALDQKLGEYHIYAAVSATRTAIDAIAEWLNQLYPVAKPATAQVSLTRPMFQKDLAAAVMAAGKSQTVEAVESLAALARDELDPYRQDLQHRGWAFSTNWYSRAQGTSGWFLHSPSTRPGGPTVDAAKQLREWQSRIEHHLQTIVAEI